MISIHALREESDVTTPAVSDASAISIHALREESDPWDKATQTVRDNFNPRSPWGERHFLKLDVYIHTQHFNPRSPWGERLDYFSFVSKCDDISIHALREESDKSATKSDISEIYFNPRSPWGERRYNRCFLHFL